MTAMIDNGDCLRLGPHAVLVYLVIKSYANGQSGLAFPSNETIRRKSGISLRQIVKSLKLLAELEYLKKERRGRKNFYLVREKIEFKDFDGRVAGVVSWDYVPNTMRTAHDELKEFLHTGRVEAAHTIEVEQMSVSEQAGVFVGVYGDGADE